MRASRLALAALLLACTGGLFALSGCKPCPCKPCPTCPVVPIGE